MDKKEGCLKNHPSLFFFYHPKTIPEILGEFVIPEYTYASLTVNLSDFIIVTYLL